MFVTAFFTNEAAQPSDVFPALVINFSTMLTILCWIFITLFLASRFNGALREKFGKAINNYVFMLLWLIPVTVTFLSLLISEFLGWTPCRLCWYQRFFMYGLAVLMLVYYFKRIKAIRIVGYVLATVGPAISLYHAILEKYPQIEATSCDPSVPCTSPWFTSMGFLTLAGMALTGFITINILLYLSSKVESTK